jgi:hypothetical protein
MLDIGTTKLWSECEDSLKKYFVYDKIFDLFLYDTRLDQLKIELAGLKRDKFEPNYKFIFLHYDTDFYLSPNAPGILMTNLQLILKELDIPNYFCLIITNHDRLSKELEYVRVSFTNESVPIANIFCQLQQVHITPNPVNVDVNVDDINLSYSCFNYVQRNHRHTLISMLKHKGLLEKGLLSYVS